MLPWFLWEADVTFIILTKWAMGSDLTSNMPIKNRGVRIKIQILLCVKSCSRLIIFVTTRDICFSVGFDYIFYETSRRLWRGNIISCWGLFTFSNFNSWGVYDDKVHVTRVKRIEVWLLGSRIMGERAEVTRQNLRLSSSNFRHLTEHPVYL